MSIVNLSKRPAHSLLFIDQAFCCRLDVDKHGAPLGELLRFEFGCEQPQALAASLQQLLETSPASGRTAWVLFSGLAMHMLSIPSVQIEGVDQTTLKQVLLYEIEGLTGDTALDAELGMRLLGSQYELMDYFTVSVPQLVLDDVLKTLKQHGSKLGGLLHPGALPTALGAPDADDWLRLEAWSGQVLGLRKTALDSLQVKQFAAGSAQHSEIEDWMNAGNNAGWRETLQASASLELLPETGNTRSFEQPETIGNWLTAWARALIVSKDESQLTLLKPQSRFDRELMFMVASGAAAFVVCAAHLGWTLYLGNYYQAEITRIEQGMSSIDALRKSLATQRTELSALREAIAGLKKYEHSMPRLITVLQQRPAQLLTVLAISRPDKLVIESIDTGIDGIVIKGVTLEASQANQLASSLKTQLHDAGWRIVSPTKKNMNLFESGGPWSFEIKLNDQGVDSFEIGDSG